MRTEQIEALGASLAECRRAGTLRDLPVTRISSAEEAQDVQTAAMEAYGGMPIGYSVQATSVVTRRLLCCDTPIFGTVIDSDMVNHGARFRLPRGVIGAGCSFSFTLARPYPGDREVISREVRNAISTARLAIELLGRRVPGSTPLNNWTATADFALAVAIVIGPRIDDWSASDLAGVRVAARINGTVAGSGHGADIMQHPLEAIVWLARALAARGGELDAGDVVLTGSCVGLFQVLPGQTFEGDFGGLGCVGVSFE